MTRKNINKNGGFSQSNHSISALIKLAREEGLEVGRTFGANLAISCPECKCAPKRSRTLAFASGAIVCQLCGHTTGFNQLRRERGAARIEGAPFESKELDEDKATFIDVAAVWEALHEHQGKPGVRAPMRQWMKGRGWPDEAVSAAMAHPDIQGVPPSSQVMNPDARAVVRMCKDGPGLWRVLLWLRNAVGQLVSGKRRATWDEVKGVKSAELSSDMTGAHRGVRCFGCIPIAALASRIVIVEGGPDWLAVHAVVDDNTVVLGASSMSAFTPTAIALAAALEGAGRTDAEVILWPDASTKARALAREAIGPLQRTGARVRWVERDEVPDVEDWEASDVLAARGVDGLRKALAAAAFEPGRELDFDSQRRQVTDALNKAIKEGGQVALAASTGLGKTYIALVAMLHALAYGHIKRAILAVPTRDLANEKHNEALKILDELEIAPVRIGLRLGRAEEDCKLEQYNKGIVAAAAAHAPGGANKLCQTCPFRKECDWRNKPHRIPNGLTITTHAAIAPMRRSDGSWTPPKWAEGVDVIAYDEDVLDKLKQPLTLNVEQLASLIDSKGSARLMELDKASSMQIAEAMKGAVIGDEERDEREERENIEALSFGDENVFKRLAGRAPWFASCALKEASERRWRGSSWQGRQLTISTAPLNLKLAEGTHATLYLDATASPMLARLTLPEASWKEVGGPVPYSTEVVTLDRVISKSCQLKTDEGYQLALKVRQLFDGPDTVHATSKALVPRVEGECVGPVIHHAGTVARGSNAYKDHHTLTCDSYHTPRIVKLAEAEWLEDRATALGMGETFDAIAQAKHRLETAPLLQLIGRIRPNGKEAKRIVLMGPAPLGMPVDRVLRADELIELRGAEGVAARLRRTVREADGVWSPYAHKARDEGGWTRANGSSSKGNRRTATLPCPSPDSSSSLMSGVANHFANNWPRAAAAAGLHIAKIKTNMGTPLIVLIQPGAQFSPSSVRRALAGLDLDWFTFGKRRHELRDKLAEAVASLPEGAEVTIEALAESATTTTRTIRRWVKRAGWTSPSAFVAAHRIEEPEEAPPAEVVELAEVIEARKQTEPEPTPPPSYGSHYFKRRSEVVTLGQLIDGSAALAIPQQIEFERAAVAMQSAFAQVVATLARPGLELVSMAQAVAQPGLELVSTARCAAAKAHDAVLDWPVDLGDCAPPEDMRIWPAIQCACDGDRGALDEVLHLYLPRKLRARRARWVDMLMDMDIETRAMFVERLWLDGTLDEVWTTDAIVSKCYNGPTPLSPYLSGSLRGSAEASHGSPN